MLKSDRAIDFENESNGFEIDLRTTMVWEFINYFERMSNTLLELELLSYCVRY